MPDASLTKQRSVSHARTISSSGAVDSARSCLILYIIKWICSNCRRSCKNSALRWVHALVCHIFRGLDEVTSYCLASPAKAAKRSVLDKHHAPEYTIYGQLKRTLPNMMT